MTATTRLVSVVIIFFNTEKFIEEAIESVFAQTYDRWELLLVDDGSTDGGAAVPRRYARERPDRVRYLEHPGHENRGMSAARNLGLRHARGEYIAFLDADDVWLPHKLEQQVALLEAHPEAGMLCGATCHWHSWTGHAEDAQRDVTTFVGSCRNRSLPQRMLLEQDALAQPPTLLTRLYPLGQGNTPSMSNLIIRSEVVERVGGFEERFRGLREDYAFLTKVYLTTAVFVASTCWDKYRQHPMSCCASSFRTGRYDAEAESFLHWLEGFLSEKGHRGSEIWKALQHALWPYRHPVLAFLVECYRHPVPQTRRLLRRLLASLLWATLPAPAYLLLKARFGTSA